MDEWAFTYNGLAFGTSTVIGVRTIEGLDLPELRIEDLPRPRRHGLYAGDDLLAGRTIVLELVVTGATEEARDTTLLGVAEALIPRDDELPLTYRLGGQPEDRRVVCRPRRRGMPLRHDEYPFVAMLVVELSASDPRIYSDAAKSGSTSPPSGGGGLTFNATPNFSFGASLVGGSLPVANDGIFETPWTATLTGPLTDPRIEHLDQAKSLAFTGVLASGETLVIDSRDHSVLLNGTASRYAWLSTTSRWFTIEPGSNSLSFTAAAGAGTCLIAWRDAWL